MDARYPLDDCLILERALTMFVEFHKPRGTCDEKTLAVQRRTREYARQALVQGPDINNDAFRSETDCGSASGTLTVQEIAQRLGVTPQAVNTWARKWHLGGRHGRARKFTTDDFQFMEEQHNADPERNARTKSA